MATHQACILLGSNIEPMVNIPRAVELLGEELTVLRTSSVWESESVEYGYPNYLNLAVLVSSSLGLDELKNQILHPLESRMGRVRTEDKNAARTIDLDIILFDGMVIDDTLWQHAHQAVPVAELFPDLLSPTGESLRAVADQLARSTPITLRKDVIIQLPLNG
jgi:2-amino-4-hydroxy-6-hydroxymethyldihydropteridine diphosphokinase